MITIIDYGLGNVQAFINIYKTLHVEVNVAKNIDDLKYAEKLILPGVGHFDHAMKCFNKSGMREKVDELVTKNNIPILGVCVGMQIMADSSEEGNERGLGWIHGKVRDLKVIAKNNPLPHMGWNSIVPNLKESLFDNIDSGELSFYFLHSFYFECASLSNSASETFYGSKFCSSIHNDNIFGVQFHPEKSHHYGVNLLKNFSEI